MGNVNKITITKIQVSKESGKETYSVTAKWETEETPQPYTGKYLTEIKDISGTAASGESEGKSIKLNGVSLDAGTFYTLYVTAQDSQKKSDFGPVLQHTYENVTWKYDGRLLCLKWDNPSIYIGMGKCTVKSSTKGIFSYDIPPYTCGIDLPIEERLIGENPVLSVTLTPYSSLCSSGPAVDIPSVFCAKYIVTKDSDGKSFISYKKTGPGETSLEIFLEGDIYTKKPDAPIEKGPLSLGIEAPYKLAIQTGTRLERADYDAFVNQVSSAVTAKAMYEILDIIARSALQSPDDILYFHCGLRPEQRCADVRPGMALRLEQEMYLPKTQLSGGDTAGFIGTHTAEYQVSLAQGENLEYLEFDSFLALMEEEIYPPAGQEEVKPVGAGIIDLCAVRMRQPFYRIQYPQAMYSSDAEPDIYPGNQVLLLAAPGWQEIPLPVSGVKEKEAQIQAVGAVPYLMFRGRSALTLLITVMVNGIEKRVPAGTTAGKMLRFMGISATGRQQAVLYRRSPFGEMAAISCGGGILEEMPLMHGDRIEG